MQFLNLALIGGAALAAVPVLIHLLNRRRYRETLWAAMEFLREAVKHNATRLRLEDVVLLGLRMLVVALAAVALARPTVTGRWAGVAGLDGARSTAAIIVLDNSYSMGAVRGRGTLFDQARDLARGIVRTLPKGAGSSAAVLLVNDRVEPLVDQMNFDLNAVDQALATARLSDGGTDFLAAMTLVRDTLLPQVKAARTEVHLITDAQRRPWAEGGQRLAQVLADVGRRASLYIDAVPAADAENLALTALRIQDLATAEHRTNDVLPSTHAPTILQATVQNVGQTPREFVAVDLLVDGQTVDRQVIPRVPPGGRQNATFRTSIRTAGSHALRAQLALGPADRLPADNVRYLSVYVYDQVRVLLVDGDPHAEPYKSETDFLRLALAPIDLDAPNTPFLITTEVRALDDLEGLRLADYRVIMLANVAGVSQALAGRLARFVGDGGGLVFFLGDQVDVREYNDVLYADGQGLLPARLTARLGDPTDETRAFGLLTGGLTHYLVNHYEPTDPTLSRVRVRAAIGADPPPAAAGVPPTEVVLRYTTGQPAVLTRPIGLGHVVLVTTSADPDWANFPTTNALLPLVQRAVNFLVFGQHAPDRLNLLRGRPFFLRLRPDEAVFEVKVTDPEGNPRAFPGAAGRERIDWPDTWRAGFYRVDIAAAPPAVEFFTVNLETAESDLTRVDEAALRQMLAGVSFTWLADAGGDLAPDLQRRRLGAELWPYLLGAVVLLLIAEGLLARTLSLRGG
jgi:hypothetical protein